MHRALLWLLFKRNYIKDVRNENNKHNITINYCLTHTKSLNVCTKRFINILPVYSVNRPTSIQDAEIFLVKLIHRRKTTSTPGGTINCTNVRSRLQPQKAFRTVVNHKETTKKNYSSCLEDKIQIGSVAMPTIEMWRQNCGRPKAQGNAETIILG